MTVLPRLAFIARVAVKSKRGPRLSEDRSLACFASAAPRPHPQERRNSPNIAQVVALDECDPVTFNAAVGPDFCRNVTLGAFTTVADLFTLAEARTPDPGWDFEPDKLVIKKGTVLS